MPLIYQFAKIGVNTAMTSSEIRRSNLHLLVDEFGRKPLIARIPKMTESYLSQLLGEKKPKPMGDKVARKIEAHTGKPWGWLDERQAKGADERLRHQAALVLEDVWRKLGIAKNDFLYKDVALRGTLIKAFVRYMQAHGELDDNVAMEMVKLAIDLS